MHSDSEATPTRLLGRGGLKVGAWRRQLAEDYSGGIPTTAEKTRQKMWCASLRPLQALAARQRGRKCWPVEARPMR